MKTYTIFELLCNVNKWRYIGRTSYRNIESCFDTVLMYVYDKKREEYSTLQEILTENNFTYNVLNTITTDNETDARKLQQSFVESAKNKSSEFKLMNKKDAHTTPQIIKQKQIVEKNSYINQYFYKLSNDKKYYIIRSKKDYETYLKYTEDKKSKKPQILTFTDDSNGSNDSNGSTNWKLEQLEVRELKQYHAQEYHQKIINEFKNEPTDKHLECLNVDPVHFTSFQYNRLLRTFTPRQIMEKLDMHY